MTATTTLKKEHFIIFRDVQKLTKVALCLLSNGEKWLAAMRKVIAMSDCELDRGVLFLLKP